MDLSTEKIRFLSTRRCRHFLAAIAPQLLKAIAAHADPDSHADQSRARSAIRWAAKGCCGSCSASIRPRMRLYVELCSSSQYLSGILTSNPGMIDELMDSLRAGQAADARAELRKTLADLRAAPKTSSRFCIASRTRSNCASAFATSWARRTSRARWARSRTSPRPAWNESRTANTKSWPPSWASRRSASGPRTGERCRVGDSGLGQVRRPRTELPQRPGRRCFSTKPKG